MAGTPQHVTSILQDCDSRHLLDNCGCVCFGGPPPKKRQFQAWPPQVWDGVSFLSGDYVELVRRSKRSHGYFTATSDVLTMAHFWAIGKQWPLIGRVGCYSPLLVLGVPDWEGSLTIMGLLVQKAWCSCSTEHSTPERS